MQIILNLVVLFQDVQFTDLTKSFPFGIAVFDNSQVNHLFHTETLELKFQ